MILIETIIVTVIEDQYNSYKEVVDNCFCTKE